MSPVAWQHINLFGKFEFSEKTPVIDIDALAALYADQTLNEGDEGSSGPSDCLILLFGGWAKIVRLLLQPGANHRGHHK